MDLERAVGRKGEREAGRQEVLNMEPISTLDSWPEFLSLPFHICRREMIRLLPSHREPLRVEVVCGRRAPRPSGATGETSGGGRKT